MPPLERVTNAALSFAGRCEEIAELTREIARVPDCGRPEDETPYCTDRLMSRATPEEPSVSIRWWEASEEQLARMCEPCRERVDLWRERVRLKRTLGGLKRALLGAYRNWLASA